MCEVRELTYENRTDAEVVIRARFPESALLVLEKVMNNPIRDEHVGFGDILYVDGKPMAFRAALRRRLYIGQNPILARVRGLTCRLVDSPKDSISRLVDAQKANPRGCLLAISNTQCAPTERRALQNGAVLGPDTCKRFIWRAVRPLKCLLYFIRRKLFKMQLATMKPFSTLGSADFSVDIGGLKIKRLMFADFSFFGELMERYLLTNQGIVSSRSAEEIEWIYEKQIKSGSVVVLGAYDFKGPVGYILLKSDCEAVRWILGDLLAVDNRSDVVQSLLKVGCQFLKRHTPAMMLESIGFSKSVEAVLKKFMPHTRKCDANFDSFNFFSESDASRYNNLLLSDKSWFFGPYDGDMCLDA